MRITFSELTVDFSSCSESDLLADWRWLLRDAMQLLLVSALGDAFLVDEQGQVHWLDTGWAHVTTVAKSVDEFKGLMVQPDRAEEWFVPDLVGNLIEGGSRIGPGQCFSYKVPPVLGGKLEPGNLEPTDLAVHFSILGQIHEQTKDLPVGTRVGKFTVQRS